MGSLGRSFKKSQLLLKISSLHQMSAGSAYQEMMLLGDDSPAAQSKRREMQKRRGEGARVWDEFLGRLISDPGLKPVLQKYSATRDTLEKIHEELSLHVAAQIAGGHYVAASALAFPDTLEFCLQTRKRAVIAGRPLRFA